MTDNVPHGASQDPATAYVTDTGQELVIEDVTITDPVVVTEVKRYLDQHRAEQSVDPADADTGPDPVPHIRTMLHIGAVAVQATDHAADAAHTDRLLAEFGRRTASMSEDMERHSTGTVVESRRAVTEALVKVEQRMAETSTEVRTQVQQDVGTSMQTLSTEITRLFGAEDSVVEAKVDKLIAKASTELLEKVAQQAELITDRTRRGLDLSDPDSPLSKLKRDLDDQQRAAAEAVVNRYQELATKIDGVATAVAVERAVTRANRVTPLKGASFADGVHRHFDQIAAAWGDSYTDTSSEVGLVSRSKKGDGVLRILDPAVGDPTENDPPQLVVEMSDSDTVRRDWVSYLDEAERNRGAVASLGLVRRLEQLPGGERIRMFGPRRIVAVFDPDTDDPAVLRTMLQMLRIQAILTRGRRGTEHVRTAEEKLREATDTLVKLSEVQKAAGTIRRSAEKIDLDCGGLHSTLARLLREALDTLSAAAPEDTVEDGFTGEAA